MELLGVEILDLRLSRLTVVWNYNLQLAVNLLPRHLAHIAIILTTRVHVIIPRHWAMTPRTIHEKRTELSPV